MLFCYCVFQPLLCLKTRNLPQRCIFFLKIFVGFEKMLIFAPEMYAYVATFQPVRVWAGL